MPGRPDHQAERPGNQAGRMDDAHRRVCVARIGAAHGVRGEVRLWSFTEDPYAVARYGPLESVDGAARFEIASLKPGKGFFVARLTGVADRSAAERLRNVDLYVPRARLPPAAEGEFYHSDLIGLAIVDPSGVELGVVVAVQNFGAGDIIEARPAAGGETVMLPFTESVVPVVDIAGGRIVVEAPDGLVPPGNEESRVLPDPPPQGGSEHA